MIFEVECYMEILTINIGIKIKLCHMKMKHQDGNISHTPTLVKK